MKDFMTVIGILAGFGLIMLSMMFSMDPLGVDPTKLLNFVDLPSLFVVLGGTIATVVASYPTDALKKIPKHMKILVSGNRYDPMIYIEKLVEFSQIARKNGLLALEEKANAEQDPFFKQSIMLIVDATDPEKVKSMLENDLDKLATRHDDGVGIYSLASEKAPAYGMIGTLIGLINMLKGMDMSSGESNIGADMSVALITTLYGCIFAHLIFSSIATKLRIRGDEEYLCKEIIIAGVLSIQSGETPKFMEEKLISLLEQSVREKAEGMASKSKDE